jgi:hypothetical protein
MADAVIAWTLASVVIALMLPRRAEV